MPAGDVFGLDGFFLNKSNPITVSAVDINSTAAGAGITVVSGVLNATAGIATLTLSTAAGLSTTPFYVGAKIAVSGITSSTGIAFPGYNGNFIVTGFAGTTTVSYATTGYVGGVTAGITTTGLVMLVTDTAVTNTTWSSAQTHGWFGGGFTPTPAIFSIVDRIDFSNDTGTANTRSPLSLARQKSAATGNSNYGWFGGGATPTVVSTVNRIDFSNDSGTASVRGPLSSIRYNLSATGNSNYGWFGNGNNVAGVRSTVDRIDFSNDSATVSPRGAFSVERQRRTATGNSNYGWFGGGSPAAVTTVDRIDFSNDSATASPRGPLSAARYNLAATGNSNYGWFGGGASPTTLAIVDRIDFSNDSVNASSRGSLSLAKYGSAAAGNSNYGWFGAGAANASVVYSTVDRIDFSNDSSTASVRGPLSAAKYLLAATSGQARSSSVRLAKTSGYGWFGGGYFTTTPSAGNRNVATVDRIDFSNDSTSAFIRGSLSVARYRLAATGNSNYGWFGGNTVTVDRINFSNDSTTASVRGSLSSSRYDHTATGNSNYGWFGGGGPGPLTTVDRVDFSNDSSTPSPRGPLSLARQSLAATGNSNYGWFGGGSLPGTSPAWKSIVDRIDFSNDSAVALLRGLLSGTKDQLAATGNSNYGWFGGGNPGPTPAKVSTVDRIDFSNDSAAALIRGSLNAPAGRYIMAATSNSNYGWFGGGAFITPPTSTTSLSLVDRIDFSNDSITTSPRGPLSLARTNLAATSNTSFS